MSRYNDREESFRIAAEKVRLKKEKEALEEQAFYERISSGKQWLMFKIVTGFCSLILILTTIDTFIDGPTQKITENDCKINRDWEWTWHKVLDVKGYMFAPESVHWSDRVENSQSLVYSPIFHTGKKLRYVTKLESGEMKQHEELRERSIFSWFPTFQLFLLVPLITVIFKRKSPWFNFARIFSLVFVLPATLLVIFFNLM